MRGSISKDTAAKQGAAIAAEAKAMERRLAFCEEYVAQLIECMPKYHHTRQRRLKKQLAKYQAAAVRLKGEIAEWNRTHCGTSA